MIFSDRSKTGKTHRVTVTHPFYIPELTMTTIPLPAFEPGHPFKGAFDRLNRWLDLRLAPTRQSTASDISLAHGGIHAVTSFRGGRIECTAGAVWLTHDGDCRDVVLEAGQSHMADRDSRLVIYALSSSAVRLASAVALAGDPKTGQLQDHMK